MQKKILVGYIFLHFQADNRLPNKLEGRRGLNSANEKPLNRYQIAEFAHFDLPRTRVSLDTCHSFWSVSRAKKLFEYSKKLMPCQLWTNHWKIKAESKQGLLHKKDNEKTSILNRLIPTVTILMIKAKNIYVQLQELSDLLNREELAKEEEESSGDELPEQQSESTEYEEKPSNVPSASFDTEELPSSAWLITNKKVDTNIEEARKKNSQDTNNYEGKLHVLSTNSLGTSGSAAASEWDDHRQKCINIQHRGNIPQCHDKRSTLARNKAWSNHRSRGRAQF